MKREDESRQTARNKRLHDASTASTPINPYGFGELGVAAVRAQLDVSTGGGARAQGDHDGDDLTSPEDTAGEKAKGKARASGTKRKAGAASRCRSTLLRVATPTITPTMQRMSGWGDKRRVTCTLLVSTHLWGGSSCHRNGTRRRGKQLAQETKWSRLWKSPEGVVGARRGNADAFLLFYLYGLHRCRVASTLTLPSFVRNVAPVASTDLEGIIILCFMRTEVIECRRCTILFHT